MWTCTYCGVQNDDNVVECAKCDERRSDSTHSENAKVKRRGRSKIDST